MEKVVIARHRCGRASGGAGRDRRGCREACSQRSDEPSEGRAFTCSEAPSLLDGDPGETLTTISGKTGLSVATLEAYNPTIDPQSLIPGERLNLWRHPPTRRPNPKPLGPRFWTVRPGQSFGSIAAKTRISIVKLEELNRQLRPSALQPGDRVRLR
jgi:hypothetical protein